MTAPIVPVDLDDVRLRALERQPAAKAGPAAAKALEVLFLTQLLRAMRKTIPENDLLPRSPARDVYEGVFDRTVAAAGTALAAGWRSRARRRASSGSTGTTGAVT